MAINGNGKIKGGIISVVGNAFFFFFDIFDVLIPLIDLTVFLRFCFVSFCLLYYILY